MKKITSYFKSIILTIFTIFFFNCSNDDNINNSSYSTTKLYAIEGVGSELKIVELNPLNGSLESVFLDFEPKQGRVYFDFAYLNTTNQLVIREWISGSIGNQLIKVDIDTKEKTVISSESFSGMNAGNGRLFALNSSLDNSVNLVEVNPATASIKTVLEVFKVVDDFPQNNKTGVFNILYSNDTDEVLISRRTSFISGSKDELIKKNINSNSKKIISINHYESMTVGRNGRLFAYKKTYDTNLGSYTFNGIVEVDINDGKEINIIKEFDKSSSFYEPEIIFLSETNEILIDTGILYKINVDTKAESVLNNNGGFYSYRSVNIY